MVNLCRGCHEAIHADEKAAALEGWIVMGRDPSRSPYLAWRGWVLPDHDGGLTLVDFETGSWTPVSIPDVAQRVRNRRPKRRPPVGRQRVA